MTSRKALAVVPRSTGYDSSLKTSASKSMKPMKLVRTPAPAFDEQAELVACRKALADANVDDSIFASFWKGWRLGALMRAAR